MAISVGGACAAVGLLLCGVCWGAYHARKVKARVHGVQAATRRAASAVAPPVQAEPRMLSLNVPLEKHVAGATLDEL